MHLSGMYSTLFSTVLALPAMIGKHIFTVPGTGPVHMTEFTMTVPGARYLAPF